MLKTQCNVFIIIFNSPSDTLLPDSLTNHVKKTQIYQTCGCSFNLLPHPPCLEGSRTSSLFLTQFLPTFNFPSNPGTAQGISLSVLKSFNLLKTTISVCICTVGLYPRAPTRIQLLGCYVIPQATADAKNGHI